MRKIYFLSVLLCTIYSCSQWKDSHSQDLQLLENGELIASIFKIKNNEYHIWTNKELKDSEDAIHIRNELKIEKELVTYFYEDSTLDEGHYYASHQSLFRHNPILKNESINGKTEESKKLHEYSLIYERIIELKDVKFCKATSDIKQFMQIIKETKEAILMGEEGILKEKARKALSAFQKLNFPLARKLYYQNAKDRLWEKDINVSLSGKNITFTGYMFVKNKIIEDTYLEIKEEVMRLRFNSVGFMAFDGDDKTYWELNPPKDSEI